MIYIWITLIVEPGVASSPAANGNGRVKAESGTVKTEHTSVKREQKQRIVCPYLDTINRNVLDFDFEKICSVSLSKINVYACLICGKYYQGKGKNTHAYTHALEANHHVFVNLHTERLYCLPDDYEIFDASLQDIQYNLHPVFNKQLVAKLDTNTSWVSRTLSLCEEYQ